MSLAMDVAYLGAGIVAGPLLLRKSLRTGKYQSDLPARLGFGPDLPARPAEDRLLLLHCVSVGELNSVQTLIERLLTADLHLHIALTTTTDTGTARARKLYPAGVQARVHTARFPFDFSFAVESLFDRLRPDAIALVELETWPNFLEIARARRIPVALINGRLSERSFPRYRLIRPVMKCMLDTMDRLAVQTPAIAQRFLALGAPAERLQVIPTLKYDNAQIAGHVPGQEALAAAMGLKPEHALFVAGSTGPGEELALLDAYQALRGNYPELRLAIVPRHPEVVPQVIAAIRTRGLGPILRTERPDASPQSLSSSVPQFLSNQVFVLNTMGELRKLYALAFGVFVGRSLIKKGGGGSDMIEVAALGKPCCFGPFTANFAEAVELLLREGAAVEVQDAGALGRCLAGWLKDPAGARQMGLKSQGLIKAQQGSTDRYVQYLLALAHRRKGVSPA